MTVGEEEEKGKAQVCSPDGEHMGKHTLGCLYLELSLSHRSQESVLQIICKFFR